MGMARGSVWVRRDCGRVWMQRSRGSVWMRRDPAAATMVTGEARGREEVGVGQLSRIRGIEPALMCACSPRRCALELRTPTGPLVLLPAPARHAAMRARVARREPRAAPCCVHPDPRRTLRRQSSRIEQTSISFRWSRAASAAPRARGSARGVGGAEEPGRPSLKRVSAARARDSGGPEVLRVKRVLYRMQYIPRCSSVRRFRAVTARRGATNQLVSARAVVLHVCMRMRRVLGPIARAGGSRGCGCSECSDQQSDRDISPRVNHMCTVYYV